MGAKTIEHKTCKTCGQLLPVDADHFPWRNDYKKFRDICRKCDAKRARDYYHAHRDKVLKTQAIYRKLNLEKIREKNRRNHYRDLQASNQRCKEFYQKNKDKFKARSKTYRHSEHGRNIRNIISQKRETLKKHLPVSLTLNDWKACKEYFSNEEKGEACAYCREAHEVIEQDHFISITRGGGYTKDNIIPACRRCNSSKGNRDFLEWYPQQIFYNPQNEAKIIDYLSKQCEAKLILEAR